MEYPDDRLCLRLRGAWFLHVVPPRNSARSPSSKSPQQQLGIRVRALREERRWSQSELAELADLDVSYVSQVERGLRDPSLSSLIALAGGLRVTVSDLLPSEAQPNRATPLLGRLHAELGALTNQQAEAWIALIRVVRRESPVLASSMSEAKNDAAKPAATDEPSRSKPRTSSKRR